MAFHGGRLLVLDGHDDLWNINPADPDDETGDYGEVGDLPSGLTRATCITSLGGRLYVANAGGDDLWNINPNNPADETGNYGRVGYLGTTEPAGMTSHNGELYVADGNRGIWRFVPNRLPKALPPNLSSPQAITSYNGDLLVANTVGDELWRINPEDPTDESGDYGLVGRLPPGMSRPRAMTLHNGSIYVIDTAEDELWNINPDNPADETGGYGLVGDLPSRLNAPAGMTSLNGDLLVIESSGELWNINPADPDDEASDYGMVGIVYRSGNYSLRGLTSHGGSLYAVSSTGALVRINRDNPADLSAGYGLIGNIQRGADAPSGLANDHVAGVDVVNYTHAFDYLLGESRSSAGNFSRAIRVYHDGRVLPEIEHALSAPATLGPNAESDITLPDHLRVNVPDWYVNFTIDFLNNASVEAELLVQAYDSPTNTITVTNPGAL